MQRKLEIEESVARELKALVDNKEKIVVGVSGGPDSMCLLDILRRLEYNIIVAHINHMIRVDANSDEEYVKKYCNKWSIPVYIKKVDVNQIANSEKLGLEETGRKVRYEFYDEVLKQEEASKIATAHNKNDFAETVIMNVLRGSGINGLKSIEKVREGKYIKPLLSIERKDIEAYCEKYNLQPRIDSTNSDNTYTRNKIRNIVIPYIKQEFNPNIVQTLARMSEIVSVEQEYIEKQTIDAFNRIKIVSKLNSNENNSKQCELSSDETIAVKLHEKNDCESNLLSKIDNENNLDEREYDYIVLDLKEFNRLDLAIKRRLIIYSIGKLFGTKNGIEKIHIDDIIKLCANNVGNKYLTPNKNVKILIKNKQIYILKNKNRYDIVTT